MTDTSQNMHLLITQNELDLSNGKLSPDETITIEKSNVSLRSDMQQQKSEDINRIIKPKSTNRCNENTCNKKLGLMPFGCRCELKFCSTHRLPEKHNCDFNYKEVGKKELEKKNPLIVSDKIIKL